MSWIENVSRAFKHKNYRDYFFWQFLSFIGTWMQTTAQSWLIYRLTGSALFLGFIGFAGALPALFFSPISGVVSDKFKRKNIMLVTQTLCLVQGILMVSFYYSGFINKWHILALAVFLGIVNSFDVTARQSFIPLLINKKDLLNAIALNSSMFNAARILGPALAGILISKFDEGSCFILNVVSYVPMIIFLLWVKEENQEIKQGFSSFLYLREGFSFAWKNLPIRVLLIQVGTVSFFGMSFSTLMPIFSDKILNSGSQGLGILMGASGFGAVIGGLYLASRHEVAGVNRMIGICSVLFSVCLFAFSASKNLAFSMFLLLITGFCFMIINAGSNTTMQSISPDHLRGRVISLYSMMFMGMFPLGSLTIGVLANTYGAPNAVAIGTAICFFVSLYFLSRVPLLNKESRKMLCTKEGLGVGLQDSERCLK